MMPDPAAHEKFRLRVFDHMNNRRETTRIGAYFLGQLTALAERWDHIPPDALIDVMATIETMEQGTEYLQTIRQYAAPNL